MRVRSVAGAALAVGAVLASCPVARAGAVPSYIRTYDTVQVDFPRSSKVDSAWLTALGQRFELVLEPAAVLAEGARTILVDGSGSHSVVAPNHLYRGHLADDAEADVRVSIEAGALDGYVRRGNETYLFEPLARYQPGATGRTLVYRRSDVDASALAPSECGAEELAPSLGGPIASDPSHRSTGRSGPGLGLLELTLVADFAMYNLHGTATADYILGIVNQVDGYYMAQLGVTLSVVATVVYASPGIEPFSTTTDASGLLQELMDARGAGGPLSGGGATHLFTGRDLTGSVIGIAYIDAVCDPAFGAGLSQNFVQNDHMMSLLVGHEIGHNLGAFHDGVAGSPCATTGYGWVMWPGLAADLAEEFSTCSQASIAPVVDAAQCITAATPPNCGDGVLDPDEQCDDGNTAAGDCCRVNCLLDTAGAACADDADQCTDDVCDGAGVCGHPFNDAPCDDGDICTFDGLCSSGTCLPRFNYRSLDNFKLKATVRPDVDDDGLVLAAKLWISRLASPPTAGGASIRIGDATDAVLYDATVPAAAWIDVKAHGTSFMFRAEDPLAAQTNGLVSMSVKYRPSTGWTKIKAKVAATDLSLLQGQGALNVRVQIGDALAGDCGQVLQLACTAQGSSLICR
ncbi:MAG: hypothetical protein HY899_09075 [Deltaproteobacteria bacterium]|nr:hypothetical protein [Deltaproteobacteria bacterium]